MKKMIILPAILFASLAFGQISLGLKGGVNISNFTGGDFGSVEKSSLTTFHAGGLVHIPFSHLALQPELVFSEQGAKLKKAGVETDFKISYVNIPIMLQWGTKGGMYVEAGPQGGFKISESAPDSLNDKFAKGGDFSICLGLGFRSSGGFGIGGRYNLGISKIGEFDSKDVSPDFKNAVVQFSLFYIFGMKNKKEGQ
jgi:hypothetical protein